MKASGVIRKIRILWNKWRLSRDMAKVYGRNYSKSKDMEYMEGYDPPYPFELDEWRLGDTAEDWELVTIQSPDGNGTRSVWRRRVSE
jgi:hypothetical protein